MEKQDFLEPDCFYHIFNRGNNKENLFNEDDNYRYFLNLIKIHLGGIADIYSYCLMKNHFHLALKIKSTEELNDKYSIENIHQPFSNLFNAYTKAFNKKYNREGSLFKVRFKRERITTEDYLRNVIVYIHLNPVKHKFKDDFKEYKFSSFSSIISEKPTLLFRKEVIELFNDKENFIFYHNEIFKKGMYENLSEI